MITILITFGFVSLAFSGAYLTASLVKAAKRPAYRQIQRQDSNEMAWERWVEQSIAGY